jgi:toluene monooxygenase system ferredoxin subunit
MSLHKVATLEDVWSGEMMRLEVEGECILLVNIDHHIYAYGDSCPHQNSRLSEGTLTEKTIRCARHHWEFDATSGCGVNPQNARLRVFPVKLDGEDILVDISHDTALGATENGGVEQ